MGAVCTLLGVPPTYHEAKRAFLDRRFLRRVLSVKHYQIPPSSLARLSRFLQHDDYSLIKISKLANRALMALAQHTLAIHDAAVRMDGHHESKEAEPE